MAATALLNALRPIYSTFFVPKSSGECFIDAQAINGNNCTPEEKSDKHRIFPEPIFHRQMTSLGRFAVQSETVANPNIITFFVALAHKVGEDLDVKDFRGAWASRVMERHERFRSQVSRDDDRFFEVGNQSFEQDFISKVEHPCQDQRRLIEQIQRKGAAPMDVTKCLWEIELSSGKLGSSGAIPSGSEVFFSNEYDRETLAVFRIHHSLCDGVSLAVAVGDVSDEAAQLRDMLYKNLRERAETKEGTAAYLFISALMKAFVSYMWFFAAGLYCLVVQIFRMLIASSPFERIIDSSNEPDGCRSVTWRNIATVKEMKDLAKSICPQATINDVAVAMVSHAIKCQLEYHATILDNEFEVHIPGEVNITVPVHLSGGILRQGEQLGNKIGGFVSSVPLSCKDQDDPRERLRSISRRMQLEKKLPSPLISWHLARIVVQFSEYVSPQWALRAFNAKSVAVVSNVKGFPFQVNWLGRPVQFLCAFLPLPPGIPIGVVIQSYDSVVSFGLNCDRRAVDVEKFADWMLEEYNNLQVANQSK